MKKQISLLILGIFASCSSEESIFVTNEDINVEKRISVNVEDFVTNDGTRTGYDYTGNGYKFYWTEGDALGVFPKKGYQTAFLIGDNEGVGTNTAIFDGGDWSLKENAQYAAYYPLVKDFELDYNTIPFSYFGQEQEGIDGTSHLGAYDFMASKFTTVDSKGNANFVLCHLGCLVQFVLDAPVGSYNSLQITSDKTPFIISGTFSLGDEDYSMTADDTSTSLFIGLKNAMVSQPDQQLIVTAMFAPVDLSDSKLTLSLYTQYGIAKTYKVVGQNLTSGFAVDGTKDTTPYVTFKASSNQTLQMSSAVDKMQYSVNGGPWTTLGTTIVSFGGSDGDLRLRGSNGTGTGKAWDSYSTIKFGTDAKVDCTGDIRTLADYTDYLSENTTDDRFYGLFENCSQLTSAPQLPATTLADRCYSIMFRNCTSLTKAPYLQATSLSNHSYYAMFQGCTALESVQEELPIETMGSTCCCYMFDRCSSLKTAPRLPASTLAESCYSYMFKNCESLISAPELPAETLEKNCYQFMFAGCTSLENAPALQSTKLANYCYSHMFEGCTSLKSAPALPATTLKSNCYSAMFYNCTKLISAPELPAENTAEACYGSMFQGCTSLETAPNLPAEIDYYSTSCYSYMFQGCTSLKNVPATLPSDVAATRCYYCMFEGCTSLTEAPTLPATRLQEGCYYSMFKNCSSLENAPELLCSYVPREAYYLMFCGCSKINYLKMMATSITSYSIGGILLDAAPTGTFVISKDATWTLSTYGDDIPKNWTVVKE